MAFAREIFIQIKNVIRFQQSEKEADSHYTVLGNTLVRVSNHCTYMYVWENYFNIHPKQRGMKILSLVFEDNKDTFHPNCLVTQHNNPKPIVVEEYVYPLHGNAQYLSKVDVNAIIKSLQNLGGTNRFHEPTGKAERYVRKSMNPTTQNIITDTNGMPTSSSEFGYGADDVSESSTRKNMKKNVVKLNENTLKQIVAESVKKVLNEAFEPYDLGHNPQFCHINGDIVLSEEDTLYFQRQLNGSFSARKATEEDLCKFRDVRSSFSDTHVY